MPEEELLDPKRLYQEYLRTYIGFALGKEMPTPVGPPLKLYLIAHALYVRQVQGKPMTFAEMKKLIDEWPKAASK